MSDVCKAANTEKKQCVQINSMEVSPMKQLVPPGHVSRHWNREVVPATKEANTFYVCNDLITFLPFKLSLQNPGTTKLGNAILQMLYCQQNHRQNVLDFDMHGLPIWYHIQTHLWHTIPSQYFLSSLLICLLSVLSSYTSQTHAMQDVFWCLDSSRGLWEVMICSRKLAYWCCP